jgi:protein associated with RNAse G/E
MVDLDLDVCRLRGNGAVTVVDQDEFAEHQIRYGHPPHVVRHAERAARRPADMLSEGAEPFGARHLAWLARVDRVTEPLTSDDQPLRSGPDGAGASARQLG